MTDSVNQESTGHSSQFILFKCWCYADSGLFISGYFGNFSIYFIESKAFLSCRWLRLILKQKTRVVIWPKCIWSNKNAIMYTLILIFLKFISPEAEQISPRPKPNLFNIGLPVGDFYLTLTIDYKLIKSLIFILDLILYEI